MTLEQAVELLESVKENPLVARSLFEEALACLIADLRERVAMLEQTLGHRNKRVQIRYNGRASAAYTKGAVNAQP